MMTNKHDVPHADDDTDDDTDDDDDVYDHNLPMRQQSPSQTSSTTVVPLTTQADGPKGGWSKPFVGTAGALVIIKV